MGKRAKAGKKVDKKVRLKTKVNVEEKRQEAMSGWKFGIKRSDDPEKAADEAMKPAKAKKSSKDHVHEWTVYSVSKRKCKECGLVERND